MFCMERSLKCIAGNVSILQFPKAFNVQFDLQCAFSSIRQIIQLRVCREVVTMAFNCKAMTRTGTKLNVLGHYIRSALNSFICPKEPQVSAGGVCRPGDTGV